jgi:hypothetical protein
MYVRKEVRITTGKEYSGSVQRVEDELIIIGSYHSAAIIYTSYLLQSTMTIMQMQYPTQREAISGDSRSFDSEKDHPFLAVLCFFQPHIRNSNA